MDLNTYIDLERSHRRKGAEAKKVQTEAVAWEVKRQFKSLRLERINKVTFIWRHKDKRKDLDNVEFSQKFIWDGMVMAHLIPGDGWKHRPPRTLHKHEVDANNPGCTVIIK